MIFSVNQTFSDDQAITATAASTNVIDLGAPETVLGSPTPLVRDIGKGNPVEVVIMVTESFNNLTSLSVAVQTDSADSFGSPKTVIVSDAEPLASLTAGFSYPIIRLPKDIKERYVRLNYTVVGTAPTLGKITAGIVLATQTNKTVAGAA